MRKRSLGILERDEIADTGAVIGPSDHARRGRFEQFAALRDQSALDGDPRQEINRIDQAGARFANLEQ